MDQQKLPAKSKNTILKFLPKATSSVSFQNPSIFSPSRDKRPSTEKPHKSHLGIGFSGPMVLSDTRRQFKNSAAVYEPTSPRVSCMGQVKCKNKQRAGNKPRTGAKPTGKVLRLTSATPERTRNPEEAPKTSIRNKKNMLRFKNIFGGATPSGKSSGDPGKKNSDVPSLSTMKRFSSGREHKFGDIDWTKEVATMDPGDRRYDSDEESDDERVVVPSSAPVIIRNPLGFDDNIIRVAGTDRKPRNEINLWKRRTMQQPKPLQLHQSV